jgi:anaerobic nitric oxide reductase transcription regulator
VFPLRVPPLREHREDILLLAAHFADTAARRIGVARVRLDATAKASLAEADWPGNVSELENVIARAVLRAAASSPRTSSSQEAVTVSTQHLDLTPPHTSARAGGTEEHKSDAVDSTARFATEWRSSSGA